MKIKEIESAEITNMVSLILPSGILRENLIISGGFASWLLYIWIRSPNRDLDHTSHQEYWSDRYNTERRLLRRLFSDIDIWVPSDSRLAQHKIMNSAVDLIELERARATKNAQTKASDVFLLSIQTFFEKSFLGYFDTVYLINIGNFAYTFDCTHYSEFEIGKSNSKFRRFFHMLKSLLRRANIDNEIQIMREPINSLESLFELFDMDHVKVAYYNGKLYFAEEAERSFLDGIIQHTDNFINKSETATLLSTYRAFKYSIRYRMDFSKELAIIVLNLFLKYDIERRELNVSDEAAVFDLYCNSWTIIPMHNPDTYGIYFLNILSDSKTEATRKELLKNLFGFFNHFANMQCFDDSFIACMTLSERYDVKKVLNDLLYR